MNREQAEHLLDAYTDMLAIDDANATASTESASLSLKDIILDAMTSCSIITLPSQPWYGKPIATYTPPYTVTCTGTDPAFNQVTGVDA